MTVLHKLLTSVIEAGSIGQVGTDPVAARDGYYTTVAVQKQVLTGTGSNHSVSTMDYYSGYTESHAVRMATYDEIVEHLWTGSPDHICLILAFIKETEMNTKYQYTNLHSFDDGSFLTVALLEEENWVGICYVPFNASGYPSGVKNPSYEHWREGLPYDGEGYFYNFWDYFTCTIVNGQPVVEAR